MSSKLKRNLDPFSPWREAWSDSWRFVRVRHRRWRQEDEEMPF